MSENDGGRGKDAAGHSPNSEPASKRSRLLGNVDPNSEEVRQLLKARSSHTGALAQVGLSLSLMNLFFLSSRVLSVSPSPSLSLSTHAHSHMCVNVYACVGGCV